MGFTTLNIKGAQSLNFAMPVEWAESVQQVEKATQGRSEFDWQERHIALITAGNWTAARDWCLQWTQKQPSNGKAWTQLGIAYMELANYNNAVAAYRQAIRLDPEDHYAWYVLGSTYLLLKRYVDAIDAYKQVVRIYPESPDAWNRIGLAYDLLKRYPDAVIAYRKAIQINPNNSEAWESIGSTYMELDRNDQAIAALLEAVRINPKSGSAWKLLGLAYVISGNRTAASVAVSQLRNIDPAKADELFRLVNGATKENSDATDGWVKVGSDSSDATYANPSTIRRNGVMVKMWDIIDFKKAQSIDKAVKPYKSTMSYSEYDCEEKRLRRLSSSWRSDAMGKGNVVFSNHDPSEWIAIPPNSRGERLWSVACGKPQ